MTEKSSYIQLLELIASQSYKFRQDLMNSMGLPELAPTHGEILHLLNQNTSMAMGELAQGINRDKSTITSLIKKLETLGLVKRDQSKDDRRKVIITLTEKGKKYKKPLATGYEKLAKILSQNLNTKDEAQLTAILKKIASAWESQE
jgi:MarR family transcriptional regulator, organic hydroperoxide resistance regulator